VYSPCSEEFTVQTNKVNIKKGRALKGERCFPELLLRGVGKRELYCTENEVMQYGVSVDTI